MAQVRLADITADNWQACIKLRVAESQRHFVADNVYSLAQAKAEPWCVPLAIYAGETMVGFAMYGPDPDFGPDRDSYLIYRLMIDVDHQRRGYGRASVRALIERMRGLPECREVLIGYHPDNVAAEALYRGLGFTRADVQWPGEIVLAYALR